LFSIDAALLQFRGDGLSPTATDLKIPCGRAGRVTVTDDRDPAGVAVVCEFGNFVEQRIG
jgi:hypothetical protein